MQQFFKSKPITQQKILKKTKLLISAKKQPAANKFKLQKEKLRTVPSLLRN